MKFLIYGINFLPELTGIGKYTGEMALWLAQRGYDVEVVTAPPYYPEWTIANGYSGKRYRRDVWPAGTGKVRAIRCPLWVPNRISGTTRLLHLGSFALSSLPAYLAALRQRPDMVVVIIPTLAIAPFGWLLAKAFGARTWLHVQDFEVDAAFDMGLVQASASRRWALAIESMVLRRFDRVSTISDRMADRLVAKGVPPERIVFFPNWVDLDVIRPLPVDGAFRERIGLTADEIVVLYAGNMGEKQGLEVLIDAARELVSFSSIRFVLAGAGAARSRMEQLASGLSNVLWLPLQPADQLNEMLNAADIHVLPQRADAADLVMPSKLTGMLSSGRAVVGTALMGTQLGDVLAAVGVRVDPGDAKALAQEVMKLALDADERKRLGALGRAYAEAHLDRDRIMEAFEQSAFKLARAD